MAPVIFLVGGVRWTLETAGPSAPTGALYSSLLLLHVLCAVVGFGTVVVTGVQAARARRGPSAPGAEGVRRYFRPGVNWAGRALYGVPVFGFGLIGASDGAFRAGDGFVVVGLALWTASAFLAELVVWPGERRIQSELTGRFDDTGRWDDTGRLGDTDTAGALDRDCRQVSAAAAVLAVLFVVATVIMVGKP